MSLSHNPEKLCVCLAMPHAIALALSACPDDVASRHELEKNIQDYFFKTGMEAFVAEGQGDIKHGRIYILTDDPAAALSKLKSFFQYAAADVLPYVHIGWEDREDGLWRTAHPFTTRPFWTCLVEPETLARLMEKGRTVKA